MQMNSLRRKLAIATWNPPKEGNIYGKLTLDVTEALAFIKYKRKTSANKITITTLVGKAVAVALTKAPGLNGRIRFGSFIPHPWVNITFLVALEGGSDLATVVVKDADQKSIDDIAGDLRAGAMKLHKGEDKDFNSTKGLIKLIPSFMLGYILSIVGYLTSVLGLGGGGLKPFPAGSAIITNVGVFGLDEGFAPPTPFLHVPLYVLMGAVKDSPLVVDGEIKIRQTLTVTATIDHRFMDGAQGGALAKTMRKLIETPWSLDGLEGRPDDYDAVVAAEDAPQKAEEPAKDPVPAPESTGDAAAGGAEPAKTAEATGGEEPAKVSEPAPADEPAKTDAPVAK